jgi:hypothetical protein
MNAYPYIAIALFVALALVLLSLAIVYPGAMLVVSLATLFALIWIKE